MRLTGRVHYAKLWINGEYAGEYLFNDSLDISKYAVEGENKIEIEITTGSRNLFGPFHDSKKTETFYAYPYSFTFIGSWDNFKCDRYTDRYSFARTGLFEYDGMLSYTKVRNQ